MKSTLETGRTQRKGHLPVGCSPIALSDDPETLMYASQVGNRATRREALRRLGENPKKKPRLATRLFQLNKGKTRT